MPVDCVCGNKTTKRRKAYIHLEWYVCGSCGDSGLITRTDVKELINNYGDFGTPFFGNMTIQELVDMLEKHSVIRIRQDNDYKKAH